MIETGRLLPYLATEFGLFLAPGPSVVYVVSRGVTAGRRAALGAVAANTGGLVSQLVVVFVVLGELTDSGRLLEVLKLTGAAWLIYLGLRAFGRGRGGPPRAASADSRASGDPELGPTAAPADPRGWPALAREGWIVGVTNPKGIVTFTALAPSALGRAHGHFDAGIGLFGLLGVGVAVICDGAWGLASGTAQAWVAGSAHHRRTSALASAGLMIAFGVGLAGVTLA